MKRKLLLLALVALFGVSCTNMVDDLVNIHRDLAQTEDKINRDRERMESANESMKALHTLYEALAGGYFVKDLQPVTETGGKTGYKVTFSNGSTITIYDGEKGSDAVAPKIAFEKYSDGIYYWTINHEWAKDENGNMIRVDYQKQEGQEGSVPMLEIRDGYWYISYDLGENWQLVGRATGQDGYDGPDGDDGILRLDLSSPDYVGFILADGTSFLVLYVKDTKVILDMLGDTAMISPLETVRIPYTLAGNDDGAFLVVESDGYYASMLYQTTDTEGYIEITCPEVFKDGHVNVIVYSQTGIVDMKIVKLREKKFNFQDGDSYRLTASAGRIEIAVDANVSYWLEMDPSAESWLSSKVSIDEETITLTYTKNDGPVRAAYLYLMSKNYIEPAATIMVTQDSEFASVEKACFSFDSYGGSEIIEAVSDYGLSVVLPDSAREWVGIAINRTDEDSKYSVIVSAAANGESTERSCKVKLMSSDKAVEIAQMTIYQQGRNAELSESMILLGWPNYTNDFTVALPFVLDNDKGYDFYVDWGDGSGKHYNSGQTVLSGADSYPSHKYSDVVPGTKYKIIISGTVPVISSAQIPNHIRTSVKAIIQWGNLSTESMSYAFEGYQNIEYLPADEMGAFAKVSDFTRAFAGCGSLKTVSAKLLDYADNAGDMTEMFSSCSSLYTIPAGLFSKCGKVGSMKGIFECCSSLQAIVAGLFSACTNVTDMSGAFEKCTALINIVPSSLSGCVSVRDASAMFKDCTSLTIVPVGFMNDFKSLFITDYMFCGCSSIEYLPESLLSNSRKLSSVIEMFAGIEKYQGESPFLIVDQQKVHLYERYNYSDYAMIPQEFAGCFKNCTGMSDYEDIPDEWK